MWFVVAKDSPKELCGTNLMRKVCPWMLNSITGNGWIRKFTNLTMDSYRIWGTESDIGLVHCSNFKLRLETSWIYPIMHVYGGCWADNIDNNSFSQKQTTEFDSTRHDTTQHNKCKCLSNRIESVWIRATDGLIAYMIWM